MFVACRLLIACVVVWCLLFVVRCPLLVVCCLLRDGWRLVCGVVRCVLFVVRCVRLSLVCGCWLLYVW